MKIFKYFLFLLMLVVILSGFILQFNRNTMPIGEMIVIFVSLLLAFIGISRNRQV